MSTLILCMHITDVRPELTQLHRLQTRDGKTINLLQGIGPHYNTFGTCLLADKDGVKISTISSDHRSVEEKTHEIFREFLRGEILSRKICMTVHP